MKRLLSFIACAILVVLAACKPKEAMETAQPNPAEATPGVTEKEVAGVGESPMDVSPPEAQARIDDVSIGHAVGADGAIATDQTGDDFAPGQPVFIAMEVGDTPAGSAIKVAWFGPGETRVGEETKTVATGQRYLNFKADTTGWAKGDYRAEVWIGDEKVNTQQLQIVDPGQAGK